jgi:phosphate-selective porin OprO/OprP
MSSAFLPSRNTGVLLHGDSPRHRFRWSFGALQPESDELDLQNTDNLGYSGRFATAFPAGEDDRYLIHLGADFWRRNIKPSIELSSRPESHIAPFFVDTGEILAQHLDLAIAEAAVQRGPLTVSGEFTGTSLERDDGENFYFYAFYAQASYFITGETARYRTERGTFARPHPKREFRDGAGGRGAFQIGFRFSRIDLSDQEVTGGILNNYSAAFNWYPTYTSKVMFNFILADLKGAEPVAVVQMRLQIGF